MAKKSKKITINLTEDIYNLIEFNAQEERRKIADLVGLWVEDVARAETRKKTDKGAQWKKPTFKR